MDSDPGSDDDLKKPVDDSRPAKNFDKPARGRPEPRWPAVHRPGLRWIADVDQRIRSLDRPDQGTFMSLTNALEFQFEAGAVPLVVHHLLLALFTYAREVGVSEAELGTSDDPDAVLAVIRPKPRGRAPR